jgi:hypothetical protein
MNGHKSMNDVGTVLGAIDNGKKCESRGISLQLGRSNSNLFG